LYGYRKAPKLWQQHVAQVFERLGFHRLRADASTYVNKDLDVTVLIHVDDGVVSGPRRHVDEFLMSLSEELVRRKVSTTPATS